MRHATALLLAPVLLGILAGTAATVAAEEEQLFFSGFSTWPPEGPGWVRILYNPQSKFPIAYGQMVSRDPRVLHTVTVQVETQYVKKLRFFDQEALHDSLKKNLRRSTESDTDLKIKLLKTEMGPFNGYECMHFRMTVFDESGKATKAKKPFIALVRGVKCPHPYLPRYVIEASYSHRSLTGAWDTALDDGAQTFLDDIEFTHVDMFSSAVTLLKEYAANLRHNGQAAREQAVNGIMARLDRKHRAEDIPRLLSLDLSSYFQGYATLLNGLDKQKRAREISLIAKKYAANNKAWARALQDK